MFDKQKSVLGLSGLSELLTTHAKPVDHWTGQV